MTAPKTTVLKHSAQSSHRWFSQWFPRLSASVLRVVEIWRHVPLKARYFSLRTATYNSAMVGITSSGSMRNLLSYLLRQSMILKPPSVGMDAGWLFHSWVPTGIQYRRMAFSQCRSRLPLARCSIEKRSKSWAATTRECRYTAAQNRNLAYERGSPASKFVPYLHW